MTYAPQNIAELASFWVSQGGVNLGIVGSWATHGKGYHLGEDRIFSSCAYKPGGVCKPGLGWNDYSVQYPKDKAGLTDAASALDLGKLDGSFVELYKFSVWLVERCKAKAPGTEAIREIIYTPNGLLPIHRYSGVDGVVRTGEGQGDNSHLLHTHISFWRSATGPLVDIFRPYFVTIPDTSTEGDTLQRFAVPKVPQETMIAAGTWLFDNSDFASSANNIKVDPGRWMPYVGLVAPGVFAVEYVKGDGTHSGTAYFVKALGTVRAIVTPPPPDTSPYTQAQLDAAAAKAKAEGFAAGKTAGYTEGKTAGYTEGKVQGLNEGKAVGWTEARTAAVKAVGAVPATRP